MKMRMYINSAVAVAVVAGFAFSQISPSQQKLTGAVTNLSEKGRRADLIFDDSNRRLVIQSKGGSAEIAYDNAEKVVFEVSTYERGMDKAARSAFLLGGPLAGAVVASGQVNENLCTLVYKTPDGSKVTTLLAIDKGYADEVRERMKAALGAKVEVPVFPEPEHVEKAYLKQLNLKAKTEVHIDRKNRPPLPEIRTGKALAFFLCLSTKRLSYRVYANDQVVAANKGGTYTYAYLDPGDYVLVSYLEHARAGLLRALRVKLEAGKDYYFYQSELGGWMGGFTITQHSRELARYQLQGFYYSDWKSK